MKHYPALFSLLVLLVAACGSEDDDTGDDLKCDTEPRADVYEPGMVASGADGIFDVALLEGTPAPPDKGDNVWLVEVRDATSGAPVADAELDATPFMPDHGHGTPIEVVITAAGTVGQLQIDRINLWMPGLWEIRLRISTASAEDDAVFAFCVEG